MEDNLGGVKLLPADNPENATKLQRYKEFYDMHENWDVEAYSMGNIFKSNCFINNISYFMMSRA